MALKEEGLEKITEITDIDVVLIGVVEGVDTSVLRSRLQATAIPR